MNTAWVSRLYTRVYAQFIQIFAIRSYYILIIYRFNQLEMFHC